MKIHLVHKVYSNNVSVVDKVFGSQKRAHDYLDRNFEIDRKDGWVVSTLLNNMYITRTGSYALVYKVMKGDNERDAVRYYIETREVD